MTASPLIDRKQVSCHSIVTIALISGRFWVTAQYLCKHNNPLFPYLTPHSGEPHRNFPTTYCLKKTRMMNFFRVLNVDTFSARLALMGIGGDGDEVHRNKWRLGWIWTIKPVENSDASPAAPHSTHSTCQILIPNLNAKSAVDSKRLDLPRNIKHRSLWIAYADTTTLPNVHCTQLYTRFEFSGNRHFSK